MSVLKKLEALLPVADVLLQPLLYPAALVMKLIRTAGVQRLPISRRALVRLGVFPIRSHYYDPQFDFRHPVHDFSAPRELPGIDWQWERQRQFLAQLAFAEELRDVPLNPIPPPGFFLYNRAFEAGDAELWYQMIRHFKPKTIIEIGSGHSTLMALRALAKNRDEDAAYTCRHVCVEPYEAPWLEPSGVEVVRKRVETLPLSFFEDLQENDILFIDSSHLIRPQGDVVFEFLQVLPALKPGVVVHVHDIFSPHNYPVHWFTDIVRFWNEQYLLEAFLTGNADWEVLCAANYLHHAWPGAFRQVAPFAVPTTEPGSFYLRRRVKK